MSYRFADSLRAGSGRNCFRPDPIRLIRVYTQISLNSCTIATASSNGWLVTDAVDTVICGANDDTRNI